MTNLNTQGTAVAVGAYYQPSPGVAISGVEPYRDTTITAQIGAKASAPGAAGAVATVTPGTAGIWEISGTVAVSGTTVATADSNNMILNKTSTALLAVIPYAVNSTTGAPGAGTFGPILASLTAADTVNIAAIGASTASSIYSASIVCRLVG